LNEDRSRNRRAGLFWLLLSTLLSIAAHLGATSVSTFAGHAMRGASELAAQAEVVNRPFDMPYRVFAFVIVTAISVAYMWPLVSFFATGSRDAASPKVQRRALGAPLALSALTLLPWLGGIATFVGVTITRLGSWSDDMMSAQIATPVLSGFIGATAQYLMLEWVFRERIVPLVFADEELSGVRKARTLPVAARLMVLAFAIGFTPAFAMIGVIAAAADRAQAGAADAGILLELQRNARRLFAFFTLTGAAYVVMFARSLTVPLSQLARAVAGIRSGDLDVHVPVRTRDEVGSLAEGVNALAGSLRERSHILRTFGRVVDPAVRDRLLAGSLSPRGEKREVAVLFADVRAFTLLAERRPTEEVVATLNELFGLMASGVKRSGGSVDKFVGDAMLAVFGLFDDDSVDSHGGAGGAGPASSRSDRANAAVPSDRAAAAALGCALRMRRELAEFAAARAGNGEEAVRVLIAVHAGPVVAATLGAEDRFDYTVVGDAVNVTSRLLDVAKERHRELVVSAEAVRRAERSGSTVDVDWRGSVELRGRSAAIEVCTLAAASDGRLDAL